MISVGTNPIVRTTCLTATMLPSKYTAPRMASIVAAIVLHGTGRPRMLSGTLTYSSRPKAFPALSRFSLVATSLMIVSARSVDLTSVIVLSFRQLLTPTSVSPSLVPVLHQCKLEHYVAYDGGPLVAVCVACPPSKDKWSSGGL